MRDRPHSKKLQQNIALALDTLAARGDPVTRREVVEFVDRLSKPEDFAEADMWAARRAYLNEKVTAQMKATVDQEAIDRLMPRVPREYLPLLFGLENWICISPDAGRDSLHMMSLLATPEHWAANAKLKLNQAERTRARADQSQDALRLLTEKKLGRLADLGALSAAA